MRLEPQKPPKKTGAHLAHMERKRLKSHAMDRSLLMETRQKHQARDQEKL
jgi:hypothetical protein